MWEPEMMRKTSAVDNNNHLGPEFSWRVAYDPHKLQTKAMYHMTHHYIYILVN